MTIENGLHGHKVGWIGLGKMGVPMTLNLLKAGTGLHVFDLNRDAVASLEKQGAHAAASVREMAERCDVVFSVIPDDAAFAHITLGDDGLIAAARKGMLYVDMSTVSPGISTRVRSTASARGVDYIAAPVSGSTALAGQGKLTVFASGPRGAYERIERLLDVIASKRFFVGSEEQARYLKLAINHMVGSAAVTLAEALTLGSSGGLEWNAMLDVIGQSVVSSPLIEYKLESLKRRDFEPAFSTRQMLKDMTLVVNAANANGIDLETARIVQARYAEHAGSSGAEEDFFSVLRLIEAKSHQAF
ncbi:NAD(P)-dependent oxidoreductase [Paraburkholderia sp. SIMBA_054]|uniref:NAD(P)-dependent oxidoreductase n=1 Tax=Paraburkholderia sp. SIMBA_054 TaxID=3085795 RepID=UPI00397C3372